MAEKIIKSSIANAIQRNFIDYAMSVIKDRALPDVRDGLKPVHRRILYSMHSIGLTPDKAYKKSARIVGDVLGKYHPHGDASVYEAMVRMAQDFSMRYPLVDGQGNWGSVDGDGAAAMRYTEAKLTRFGKALIGDLSKDTVDMIPNFDGEELEPSVLSGMICNLLLNGVTGIAVGMTTDMPPHNIVNIYDALKYMIDCTINQEDILEDKIIELVKAPDFPTGGTIINYQSVIDAYKTGNGRVTIKSKYVIENDSIIVTEIPYRVNKQKLVENIYNLTRVIKEKGKPDKPAMLPEIKEIRDESSKEGIRIVIELKKDANIQLVLNKLFKYTKMQSNFTINNVVIVNGEPKVLPLAELLNNFLAHAAEVLIRKTKYDLQKANKRIHLLYALLDAIENIDEVLSIIQTSKDPVNDLMEALEIEDNQAEYILNARLRTLTAESIEKNENELSGLEDNVRTYNDILNNNEVLLSKLKSEFDNVLEMFKDDRRTELSNEGTNINEEDLIKDEELVVTITNNGIIKSVPQNEYNVQNRGGKGSRAISADNDEIIKYMFSTNSKDNILFFTNTGRVHILKAYKIQKTSRTSRGKSIFNYLTLNEDEHILDVIACNLSDTNKSLLMATNYGIIKRLSLDKLSSKFSFTKIIEFTPGDSLRAVLLVENDEDVLLTTSYGQTLCIKINEKTIRATGRSAIGVKGMKFKHAGDYIIGMTSCKNKYIFIVSEQGIGKLTLTSNYEPHNRGGNGIISYSVNDKTGKVSSVEGLNDNQDVLIVTEQGLMIRIPSENISINGRNASGVKLVSLNEGDSVASVSAIAQEEGENTDV